MYRKHDNNRKRRSGTVFKLEGCCHSQQPFFDR